VSFSTLRRELRSSSRDRDMNRMFWRDWAFNQRGGLNVYKVKDMGHMFVRCPIGEVNKPH